MSGAQTSLNDAGRLNPQHSRQAVVVSIHDVSPHTWGPCASIVDELAAQGLRRTSLLVIPDHHRKGHFLDNQPFCSWLRAMEERGHEIVIHGYYHQRASRQNENVRTRVMTRSYTAGEGEFYDLSRDEAAVLVNRAQEEFRQAGFHPTGFIAPAWLLSSPAEQALRDAGLDYTTRLTGVWNLRTGGVHHSQSMCWSVRSSWRRSMSHAWNGYLYHRLERTSLVRIAVHPVDISHARIWRQIKRMIALTMRTRDALTYAEWVR